MSKTRDPYDLVNDGSGLRKAVPRVDVEEPVKAPKPNVPSVTISRETREGLTDLADAMRKQQEDEEAVLNEAKAKVAGTVKAEEETVKVDLGESPEGVAESMGFETVFYRMTPIDNPDVRELVEKRCTALNFSDLILEGHVMQSVEILPKRLIANYRSLRASDNLWLERQASVAQTEYERIEWIGYGRLVLSLDNINGDPLPDAYNNGKLEESTFTVKKDKVMSYPEKLIEMLLINLGWFDDRVGQLFANDYEKLKNG